MTKPNWIDLTLTDGVHEFPSTQRITDIRELRDTGAMRGVWACLPNAEGTTDALRRDQIDFSGLEYFTGESSVVSYRVVVSAPGHHERVLEVEEGGIEEARALLYAQLPDGGSGRIEYFAKSMQAWTVLEKSR